MDDKDAIKRLVRDKLPRAFGDSQADDAAAFIPKYEALAKYATAASAPVLQPETLRYQAMMLGLALVMVTLSMFEVDSVKIGETAVSVDRSLVLLYGAFILLIAVTFGVKAWVDFKRATFVADENVGTGGDIQSLVSLEHLRQRIDLYFCYEIFDAIAAAQKSYDLAIAEAVQTKPWTYYPSLQILKLDVERLLEVPSVAGQVRAAQEFARETIERVHRVQAEFEQQARRVLDETATLTTDERYFVEPTPQGRVEAIYAGTLGIWMSARDELSQQVTKRMVDQWTDSPQERRAEAVLSIYERLGTIRRSYRVTEVYAPIALTAVAVIWAMASSFKSTDQHPLSAPGDSVAVARLDTRIQEAVEQNRLAYLDSVRAVTFREPPDGIRQQAGTRRDVELHGNVAIVSMHGSTQAPARLRVYARGRPSQPWQLVADR